MWLNSPEGAERVPLPTTVLSYSLPFQQGSELSEILKKFQLGSLMDMLSHKAQLGTGGSEEEKLSVSLTRRQDTRKTSQLKYKSEVFGSNTKTQKIPANSLCLKIKQCSGNQ